MEGVFLANKKEPPGFGATNGQNLRIKITCIILQSTMRLFLNIFKEIISNHFKYVEKKNWSSYETLESTGDDKIVPDRPHNFYELWNLCSGVPIGKCFWCYFRLLFIFLTVRKCKTIKYAQHYYGTRLIDFLSVFVLTVIVRENRAEPKDRGRPFTFIFSQYKSYPKRLTTMIFAEVGVRFSSRYYLIMILASQAVQNGRNFGQL